MDKYRNLLFVFMEGFMFFFSHGANPIERYNRERKLHSDTDNISQDWINVGNDIRNSFY